LKEIKYFVVTCLVVITGCASSSDIEKSADNHAKAGSYYQSIGQPNAAMEENRQARKERDDATGFITLFVDLINLFNKK
jgi:hypothetical protein